MTNVPLLDLNDVLERLGGDKILCASLFQEFISRYQGVSDEIRSHLENESWSCAVNAAHRLKGVALNIGAKKLAGCASDLEATLKASQQPNQSIQTINLSQLNDLVPETFAELENQAQRLQQETSAESADTLSQAAIKEQLLEAKAWFDTDYGKALRLVEQLAPQCPEDEHQEVHQLLGLMKQFNIISARKALHQMV